ncbi:hypothetical protein LC040_05935 [Bacillus tianshenii]|nr:hypothetical protein LC040_05935 [Bacillus tianshenii]
MQTREMIMGILVATDELNEALEEGRFKDVQICAEEVMAFAKELDKAKRKAEARAKLAPIIAKFRKQGVKIGFARKVAVDNEASA